MKRLILLITILTTLLSCNSDDNVNTLENQQKLIKFTEIITSGSDVLNDGFVEFEYGMNGFVSKQTTSDRFTIDYVYNSDNNIIQTDYNSDTGHSYSINYTYENGLIASEVLENGNATTYQYDSNNQLISMFTASGDSIFFNYDLNGNVIEKIWDTVGFNSYQYDNMKNPRIQMYPESFNKIQLSGPNNEVYRENVNETTTTYQYNSDNFPVSSNTMLTGVVQSRDYIYQ